MLIRSDCWVDNTTAQDAIRRELAHCVARGGHIACRKKLPFANFVFMMPAARNGILAGAVARVGELDLRTECARAVSSASSYSRVLATAMTRQGSLT